MNTDTYIPRPRQTGAAAKIYHLWDRLVRPSPTIGAAEQRRQARMLAATLIALIPMYVIPEAARAIWTGQVPLHFWLTVILLTAAYALSRTRYFQFGVVMVLTSFTLLPVGTILLLNLVGDEILTAVVWVIPTLLLSTLLLSNRQIMLLISINFLIISFLPLIQPAIIFQDILFPLGVVLVCSVLLLIIAIARQQYVRQIEAQAVELAQNEAKFRSIVENSHAGILQIDSDFRFTYVNDELCHISGYSREELIGSDFRTVLDEESRRLVADSYFRRQAGEKVPSRYEFKFWRKDGEIRQVELSAAIVVDDYGRIQTTAQILDITERHRIQNALRDSEALYQSLVNNLPQNIFRRNEHGRFTFANHHFCQLHGRTLEEIIGITDFDLHPPELAQKYWADDKRVMETGELHESVELHQRNNAAIEYVQVVKTPTYGADGRVTGIQGIFWDITEIKQAQETLQLAHDELEKRVQERTQELADANAELKKLDHLKNKFIQDLSHELRTPLANLNLYLDLLEMGKPENREKYLAVLRQATSRVTRISEDVLAMIRLELFREDIHCTLINLNTFTASVIRQQKQLAKAAGLEIFFESNPAFPLIWANENRFRQCLVNLITNSISYTPEGQIEVSVIVEDERQLVCLEVADTGLGITPEDLPYLFDRFYRGQQIGQSSIPGSGLGLALVKEIIELHGGSVEAENRPEKGSVFRLWLPLANEEDQT